MNAAGRFLALALKCLDATSIAAFRTFITSGPRAARHVMSATRNAASRRPEVHEIEIWDLVRALSVDAPLTLKAANWVDGCTSPLDRFVLALLLRRFAPPVVVEVGTYRGTTTELFLDNTPEDTRIYTIDLPAEVRFGELTHGTDEHLICARPDVLDFASHPQANQVTEIQGDTFAAETWETVPNDVPFAFIDASHSYEAVKNDTEMLEQRLAPNAVVVWHDYTSGPTTAELGVGKYIRELMATRDDIFVCPGTELAVRLPLDVLQSFPNRISACFPKGDYEERREKSPTPWIEAV